MHCTSILHDRMRNGTPMAHGMSPATAFSNLFVLIGLGWLYGRSRPPPLLMDVPPAAERLQSQAVGHMHARVGSNIQSQLCALRPLCFAAHARAAALCQERVFLRSQSVWDARQASRNSSASASIGLVPLYNALCLAVFRPVSTLASTA